MKRIGFLFEKTFTIENLYAAFKLASKGKHDTRTCFEFEKKLATNLDQLYNELHSGEYRPRPYFKFIVREPKERIIYAPNFRDLIVQHAIYKTIIPIFDPTFISTSFACRKGYGTHLAADYAQKALKKSRRDSYTLKLDIRKFFYRVDRGILRRLIERKIKDKRFVDIMAMFSDYGDPVGIPIGNLLSQIYALIYMNAVDHFIKRELKVKLYCRYVDDMVLFNLTHDQCVSYRDVIERFLKENLNLEFSRTTIAKTTKGINFVGFRTWASKRFVRKRSLYKARKSIKENKLESIVSCLGHARKTHSLRHILRAIQKRNRPLFFRLPKSYWRFSLTQSSTE